ncbi:hypothetical protein JCM15765_23590 [Paradesulfitobacterium aromaticivorans]
MLEIITEENVRNYFGNDVGILPVPYMNEEIKAFVMLDINQYCSNAALLQSERAEFNNFVTLPGMVTHDGQLFSS